MIDCEATSALSSPARPALAIYRQLDLLRLLSLVLGQKILDTRERYLRPYAGESALTKRMVRAMVEFLTAVEAGMDVFLTLDEDVLAEREELESHFRIKIRKPSELVEELKQLH